MGKQFSRIGDSRLRLPDGVFKRLGGKSTADDATWSCAVCGPIAPREYKNGFVPGKCACQRAAMELEKKQQARLEQWKQQQAMQKARSVRCYDWLGDGWSDEGLAEKTFGNFDIEAQPDGFDAAFSFAGKLKGNLILWSDRSWGTGKTHLASAICQYAMAEAGANCLFTTAQNLFFAFGARMDDHAGYSDLLIKASSCDLLVLDDLDKMQQSAYKQTIFFEILDKRWKRRKPTVITTNARVDVIDNDIVGISDYIGRAAASRLFDEANGGLVVAEMNGEDYRRRKRQ